MSATEEILARYKRTETEVDAFGRQITLKPLRPAQQLAVMRMVGSDDKTNHINFMVAACVRKIDDDEFSPAKTLAELEVVINRLDDEGLLAAAKAYARLKYGTNDETKPESELEALKNG